MRLIYQGKLVLDTTKLSEYNFNQNPYIHAIIQKADNPYLNLEQNATAPARNNEELRQQILEEIQLNLDGSHLQEAERTGMINYREFIQNSTNDEIEGQRDYLSTMRTIR